ncbi:MAG TPA: serine protease, partial [Elusimicrobiales bacterium]|nr:serine protease [Elusimicrobiales bacterium]
INRARARLSSSRAPRCSARPKFPPPAGFPPLRWAKKNKLCPGEPYADEPSAAICSAVLIGPREVLTAAHCLRMRELKDIKVVFGYAGKKGANFVLPEKDVYSCAGVKAGDMDSPASDLAVLKLDRAVSGRKPVALSPLKPSPGMKVSVASYPKGMPLKVQSNASVLAAGSANFLTDADGFRVSSGAPVFDAQGRVLGVYSQGIGADLTPDPAQGGCNKFTRKPLGRVKVASSDPVYAEFTGADGLLPIGSVAVTAAPMLEKLFPRSAQPLVPARVQPGKIRGSSFD